MFQFQQVLEPLRAGDCERDIARTRPMGRDKTAALQDLANERGGLDRTCALPDDAKIVAVRGQPR